MTKIHDVHVLGDRTGDAGLTWGQQCIWDEAESFAPDHAHFNMSLVLDVPPDAEPADVLRVLKVLLEDRESLRTVYPRSASGRPYQHVPPAALLRVVERDAAGERARDAADALAAELRGVPFSLDEFPVRAGIVTGGGRPLHLVLVVFHLAADAWDMGGLAAEAEQLLGSRGAPTGPEAERRPHPLDQAAWEAGPEGQEVSRRSVRYWRKQLADWPSDVFRGRAAAPEPLRFHEVYVESEAMAVALYGLARALRTSPTAVFIGLASTALGRLTGGSRAHFLLGFHNRVTLAETRATGTVAQDAPITVDLAGADFAAVVHRAARAAMSSYAAAKWDPAEVAAAVAEVERGRGEPVDLSCNINLRLAMNGVDHGLAERAGRATPDELAELRARTRISQEIGTARDRAGRKFFLRVVHHSSDAVEVSLRADTAVLSRNEIVGHLMELEEAAVRCWADVRDGALPR
ncbi:condensation domain-containing protein [Kitasatospora sp. NPDC048365]|uniref:condensation domain-containing protein n=1 Tax=Kitasatospora sp. NPDC048365 TaxID=3364050 RepID=UPI00370F99ED